MCLALRQWLIIERLTSIVYFFMIYAAISLRYNVESRANWSTISYYSY
jgi:hypothetical protein